MSQAALTVEPAVGQIYKTNRNDDYLQILYVDEQIVLLRTDGTSRTGDNTHRMEKRVHFDKNVESGHFEYRPDSDLDMMDFAELDWSQVDYIGEKTAANLHDEGFDTALDIQQADDADLIAVPGVGEKGAANLREFAR